MKGGHIRLVQAEGERPTAASTSEIFAALGQETRLEAFRLLCRYQPYGLAAGDIARLLGVPHNTLSTHLALLQSAGLVGSRREGRIVIYVARPERLDMALAFLQQGQAGERSRPTPRPQTRFPTRRSGTEMSGKTYNVLVLCTGNSARSILAEAIINREGGGRFRAFSAGSQPKGKPHPLSLELLDGFGYDISGVRSKSWSEFAGADAPQMDFVVTVCDSAAGESCPYWPGHPLSAHWGIPDPASVDGSEAEQRAAFKDAYRRLMNRVTAFVNLPVGELSLDELKSQLAEIGRMEGATEETLKGKVA
jgi:protein-tyrosine-phosphatase/DNA-binding transcriptional ArsR family regulator